MFDHQIELLGSKFDLALRVGMRLDGSRYRARQLCIRARPGGCAISAGYVERAADAFRIAQIQLDKFDPVLTRKTNGFFEGRGPRVRDARFGFRR